ncbi:NAD-dependent deacetylase [Salinibacterium sp. NSLL150]|uniref:Sir2 family NAD-dependent protein deacetylase n=1 Tax=unclassified Salinibacterium TaxID=2632331 RepID=UPI0018CE32FE|nr:MULTISPECIES: Sir2 family NAD-dependent protein deacetylase [unclassified Salinibacterium]MBH0099142.1 NAD-dependent deacetylase [Salinibacterium sp. NSLL35]MBH0101896.1 NAD-dependent deacetylase [Salinibacterium sp. NSLL150]MBH0104656.1 NAD-dependent deacetylase [Salinibacterium sp. NSLL16]MBH0107416.1 NAD-dependent deacetylase [Salinibacterium sp. NSLL17]
MNTLPISNEIDRAAELLQGKVISVLTGAGISTDSGIPDYRGEGAAVRNPMTFQQFQSSPDFRKRYWAGSHLGWKRFASSTPNEGHDALAEFERRGISNGIVTQNVDGLHLRAGSTRVVDVHGSIDRARCLRCGQYFARTPLAARISELNPWLEQDDSHTLNPDGDADVHNVDDFVIPECTVCGGILKPDVVFFGEFVPTRKFQLGASLVDQSDAMIVAGSSLVVNSGIRLVERAMRKKIPLVIINRGVTKADKRADVKIDGGASAVLGELVERLAA